mmetsp:Transcript_17269/g.34632  ORF Transcript_17269/g.34632 Transcript_17269/m.34632 type:complete len:200 (+) Transcript_17269:112-711(+)
MATTVSSWLSPRASLRVSRADMNSGRAALGFERARRADASAFCTLASFRPFNAKSDDASVARPCALVMRTLATLPFSLSAFFPEEEEDRLLACSINVKAPFTKQSTTISSALAISASPYMLSSSLASSLTFSSHILACLRLSSLASLARMHSWSFSSLSSGFSFDIAASLKTALRFFRTRTQLGEVLPKQSSYICKLFT